MNKLVEAIQKNIKFKYRYYTIDNVIFRFHYRYTVLILLLMTLMITSQELIGEHIKCMSTVGVQEAIMNRYCFFTTTFTVVNYMNETMLNRGDILHPGVGAVGGHLNKDEVKHHAYYQWVPFVLFGQAILFYLPHMLWKKQEGDSLKKLIPAIEMSANYDKRVENTKKQLETLKKYFKDSIEYNRYWGVGLVFCEVINLFNVIGNICLTNAFLGGQFLSLGTKVMSEGFESNVDPLDVVFPKMTKCTFHKYGPSGSLQPHDALCVMALNIINEKAYVFLWFWFMFLLVISIIVIVWRLVTFCLHSRSRAFNKLVFRCATQGRIDVWQLMSLTQNCNYFHWLFLVYLAKNMHNLIFREFLREITDELKPKLIDFYDGVLDNDGTSSDDDVKDYKYFMDDEKTK